MGKAQSVLPSSWSSEKISGSPITSDTKGLLYCHACSLLVSKIGIVVEIKEYPPQYIKKYRILPGGGFFSGPFEAGYMRGGGGGVGGLIYFFVKLYDNFLPAQSNVCKTTTYSNNF